MHGRWLVLVATLLLTVVSAIVLVPAPQGWPHVHDTNASLLSLPTPVPGSPFPIRVILHTRRHGLANRLRSIAAADILARDLSGCETVNVSTRTRTDGGAATPHEVQVCVSARVYVSWTPDATVPASFSDLFDASPRFARWRGHTHTGADTGGRTGTDGPDAEPFDDWQGDVQWPRLGDACGCTQMLRRGCPYTCVSQGGHTHTHTHAHTRTHTQTDTHAPSTSRPLTHTRALVRYPIANPHGDGPTSLAKVRPGLRPVRVCDSVYTHAHAWARTDAVWRAHAHARARAAQDASTAARDDPVGPACLDVHLSTDSANVPDHTPCGRAMAGKGDAYRYLLARMRQPDAAVLQCALRQLQYRRVLGIHVRTFDRVHDYPVVPAAGTRASFGDAVLGGPQALLRQAVHTLAASDHFDSVYLATNDCTGNTTAQLHELLRTHVSRRIHVMTLKSVLQLCGAVNASLQLVVSELLERGQCPGSERSLVSVRYALMDWAALAHTQGIFGSYWSSYSEEAALVHNIPLVVPLPTSNFILGMIPAPAPRGTCGYPPYIMDRPRTRFIDALAARNSSSAWVVASSTASSYRYISANMSRGVEGETFGLVLCSVAQPDSPQVHQVVNVWRRPDVYCAHDQ